MTISDILSTDRILVGADASSKKRVLEVLSELLTTPDGPVSALTVFKALCERERKGNTGLGEGVAIPHGRLPEVHEAVAAFVKLAEPVDFDAPDGRGVDLVIGLLVPEDYTQEHVEILAGLAESLSSTEVREALRRTTSPARARELLCHGSVPV
ncbi:MAG: PTS sugar transporter subunit IIA [Ectothiorhodospiraceae bacterium]|nr:PTS sugar transporter subunit IIA [Ectothiorhodospiraceae bacterium]